MTIFMFSINLFGLKIKIEIEFDDKPEVIEQPEIKFSLN